VAQSGKNKGTQNTTGFAGVAFQQYRAGLHRYLTRRLRSGEQARDLAQEVYLRLLRFTEQELVQRPEAYLYRVAYNVLCDFRLRKEHDPVAFDSEAFERLAGEVVDEAPSPEDLIEQQAREQRLELALAQLPPMQRAVFLMQKRQGLSYADTAKQLGLSVKTVKTYLFRAVYHCRTVLDAEHASLDKERP
jgi:RNA polymerase sigma factor (sigma-70 family)